ncbi:MAG: hypothetical protein WCH40_05910 [Verrucomicrobiales bacterium]
MKVSQLRKYFLLGVALVIGRAGAETINWSCPTLKTNQTSTGQNMDGGFQFQLGVFSGGFIPIAGNMSQWAAHWVSAQTASYSSANSSFDSTFNFAVNAAPFTIGAKGYVWGRRIGSAADEWILFRKSDWTWPYVDPQQPPGFYDWNAATANEVILGTINASGTPFLMQSAAVYSYAQWRDDNLAGESLNSPNDDPDHDGVSNLLEFVFGTSPSLASLVPSTPTSLVTISGQTYLQIFIPRLRNRLATFTVEVSSDLNQWTSGDTYTAEVSNTAEALVVRDKTATGPGLPRRFMRLKAVVQP